MIGADSSLWLANAAMRGRLEETGAVIGADGRDSHLITISQLFTCLHLWQHREVECVSGLEIICLNRSLRAFNIIKDGSGRCSVHRVWSLWMDESKKGLTLAPETTVHSPVSYQQLMLVSFNQEHHYSDSMAVILTQTKIFF